MPTGTDKPMVLSEDGLPYPEDGSPFQKGVTAGTASVPTLG